MQGKWQKKNATLESLVWLVFSEALQRKIRDAESRRRPEPELPRMAMRPPMMGAPMMGVPMGGPMMGGKGMPTAPKGPPTLGGYLPTQPQSDSQASRPAPGEVPGLVKGGNKVIPCRFHVKTPGLCKNGDACPFSHDPSVIAAAFGKSGPMMNPNANPNAPAYKTTMCRYFEVGQCARGASCSYAHGTQDLRIGLTAAQQNAGGVKRSFSEAALESMGHGGHGGHGDENWTIWSVPRCVVLLLLGGTLQHFEAEPSKAVVSGPRAKPQRLTQLEAKAGSMCQNGIAKGGQGANVDGNRLKAKLELSQQLDQAIRQRDEAQAEECLEEALRQWLDISVVTFSPLIDQAAQEGDLQRAEKWFDRATASAVQLDEVEFNSLVHAAAKQGNLSAAEAWFTKAQDARIQPDAITLTAVLRAASGRAERAREWYSAAPLLRISPNEVTHSCLLHALRDNATEVAEWFETMDDFQPNAGNAGPAARPSEARSGDMEAAERSGHQILSSTWPTSFEPHL
eukprot:s282_g7.t1